MTDEVETQHPLDSFPPSTPETPVDNRTVIEKLIDDAITEAEKAGHWVVENLIALRLKIKAELHGND
jgi:hypothetical protein